MAPTKIDEICQFLKQSSEDVWQRIQFARKVDLRVSETTITENLLFDFWRAAIHRDLRVRLYEAVDEKTNGNDIEIFIGTPSGFILLVCQCKIVNRDYKYAFAKHRVGPVFQIELLLKYARRSGGVPAYLFYNYMPYLIQSEEFQLVEDHKKYGISVLPAKTLLLYKRFFSTAKRNPIPSFNSFHPHAAKPLHEFICQILNSEEISADLISEEERANIRYYAEEEIRDADSWRSILGEAIGFVPSELPASEDIKQADNPEFKPKYRIVLNSWLTMDEKIEKLRKSHIPEGYGGI